MIKKLVIVIAVLLNVTSLFSQTMEWHAKDIYADIQYLGHDLFKVRNVNGKWGILNEYGEITVEAKYDSITSFVEDRALLLDITGQYLQGIINEKGFLIKAFSNHELLTNYQYYKEGMLAYGVASGKYYLFGYLDKQGNVSISPKYYWAAPFDEGKAVVQQQSGNYSIINQAGGIILHDNRKFKFMSTPVHNQLLIAVGSSRGERIVLTKLGNDGKLDDIEELESRITISNSNDYKSISCNQNGHRYLFDDAMRLVSSSIGKKFNEPLNRLEHSLPSESFRKEREQGVWKIWYKNNILFSASFRDISFCDDRYAIVTTLNNTKGVLKLNQIGNLAIQGTPNQVTYFHNAKVTNQFIINIDGLLSSSQVQIGIKGLQRDNIAEEKYNVPKGYNGKYNQPISYFIPSSILDSLEVCPVTVNLYIDGMLYKSEEHKLTAIHKKGFKISDANSSPYSDADGNSIISFIIQSLEGLPSSSAEVIVSGDINQSRHFSGKETLNFKIPVNVPYESRKTYSFVVTVKEKGCPDVSRKINRTIAHYDLQ